MMENEVACLDITPLGAGKAHFVAAGLWTDVSALVLQLPGLDVVTKEPMKGGININSDFVRKFSIVKMSLIMMVRVKGLK